MNLFFTVLLLFIQSYTWATYYSQCEQDKFINENLFKNLPNGVFVDVGAHDGIALSNTYFFEKELGWSGICIEPIPKVFDMLQKNRTCICINGCASKDHNVKKQFIQIFGPCEMLSTIVDTLDLAHKARIDREIKEFGGSYEIVDVPCYNLNQILQEVGITHVNFLSLDIEGGEFDILQNFDFSQCPVDVIAVEDNYRIHPFIPFLESKGFTFIKSLEQDLIFVHNSFNLGN